MFSFLKDDEKGVECGFKLCETGCLKYSNKPYIFHNNKKLFVIYDPPHLLKNVTNDFMNNKYKYEDVEIMWEYINDFYNTDKIISVRRAPKLTDKHMTTP